MGDRHSVKSVKAEEWSEETGGCACSDAVRDLFAEAFLGGDEISQVTRVARDLKNDDTAPAPDAEQNAQYADTIEWLRDEDVFDDERSIASTVISKIIRCRSEAVLEKELYYWAYVLVHFMRSRDLCWMRALRRCDCDDKKYLQRAKRIMEMRDGIITDLNDGADSGGARHASHDPYDVGLSSEWRMHVGMEAVIGMMHTGHGMDLDLDTVHDVLAQGDCMWVGIEVSPMPRTLRRKRCVQPQICFLMKRVPKSENCWDLFLDPAIWILRKSLRPRVYRATFGRMYKYALGNATGW